MIADFLTLLVWLLTFLDGMLWILGSVLLIEVVAALQHREQAGPVAGVNPRPPLAVLIPAHNEEADIGATVRSILPQLAQGDRLLVVADHCGDHTAMVAREAGAAVLEHNDPIRRGKGYALEVGLSALAATPPALVIFIDADCDVKAGSLDALAHRVQVSQRPVQSAYLMKPPSVATLRDQLSEFAIVLKNWVRPLGMETLGLPCLLTGSGMAFPWSLIESVSFAGSINADDMQLTIDVALQGVPPVYEPQSRVTGRMMAAEDATSQRSRWEHGHLKVIVSRVPALLCLALQLQRLDLLILALDIAIPPLTLLIWLWLGLVLLHVLLYGIGLMGYEPLYLVIGAGGLLLLSIFLSWKTFGQTILPRQLWLQIPRYLLWKLPIYLRFIVQPQPEWVTTERDKTNPADSV